jgi:hypothetical protein
LNITKAVPYFDFFEARIEYSQAINEMKELYAQGILGDRYAKKCGVVEMYLPFVESLDRLLIDFPLVAMEVSW